MGFTFEPSVMWQTIPLLVEGLALTLLITVAGLGLGFLIGVAAGFARLSRHRVPRGLATTYIEIIRGTPLIVQAMFLYFGIPLATGVRIPPVAAGVTAIAVNSGAYIAEIVRGAVQSIERGQMEAARSIGLTHAQAMAHIIWPQAFRRMIPPLGNQFIISLKDTSLLMVIGVGELTMKGQEVISTTYRAFEIWLTVAILYFVLTFTLARLLQVLEGKLLARGSV